MIQSSRSVALRPDQFRHGGKIVLGLLISQVLGHEHDLLAVAANQEQGGRQVSGAPHAIFGVVPGIGQQVVQRLRIQVRRHPA